jgi:hypothetical protein
MAALVGIAAQLRAVLAAHVAFPVAVEEAYGPRTSVAADVEFKRDELLSTLPIPSTNSIKSILSQNVFEDCLSDGTAN